MTFVVFGMALVVVGLFVLFTRKLGISLSALGICVDFIQVNASSGLWVCSGALCGGLELVDRQSTCMYCLATEQAPHAGAWRHWRATAWSGCTGGARACLEKRLQ
jgi:hypothetical protein